MYMISLYIRLISWSGTDLIFPKGPSFSLNFCVPHVLIDNQSLFTPPFLILVQGAK